MSGHFEKGQSRDEKIDKFLDALAWYFSEKSTPTGFYHKVEQIKEKLGKLIGVGEKLNENIEAANNSSDKLTVALNKITLAGVVIAGLSLLVALGNLVFEVYKYFN
jgi:hypothetical protein